MSVINRRDKNFFSVKPTGVAISGYIKEYKTFTEMMAETNMPTYAWVVDATADPTVNIGSAYYRYDKLAKCWIKVYETELMDAENPQDQTYLGWFATPEAVASTIPIGSDGWRVMVGSTDTIWTWDSDNSRWVNTAPGATDIALLIGELNTRSPEDIMFTSASLVGTKLHVVSTKPPRGIRSVDLGTYFAIAPSEYTAEGVYIVELMGLYLPGTWIIIF